MMKPISVIEMDELTAANVSEARGNIVIASNMFAYQAYRCNIYATDDPRIPTAGAMVAAGENKVFVNTVWFNGLENVKQRAFLLLHEVEHIFLDHVARGKSMGYHPTLWNVATDFYINLVCSGAWCGDDKRIKYNPRYARYLEMPEDGMFDEKYIGLSSDEIYEKLLEENDNNPEQALKSLGVDPDDNNTMIGDLLEGDGEGDAVDTQRAKNVQTGIASTIAAMEGNNIGENEMQLINIFKGFAETKVAWTDQLSSLLTTSIKQIPTYNRVSRKSTDSVVFPTYIGNTVKLVFGVDSSGSMSESDYNRAAGELNGILEQFDSWTINYVTCDTACHEIGIYDSDEDSDFMAEGITITGGGGTDMAPIAEYARDLYEEDGELNACIIVTDGGLWEEDIRRMDEAFNPEMVNIVLVTEGGNSNIQMENAEVLVMDNL